jgi:Elongation factor G C-terminus
MQCYSAAKPVILEPVMKVEVKVPSEFQGTVTGDINKSDFFSFSFYRNATMPFGPF